ncbi:MAG: hypothetical protein WKF71_11615 [Pyrinomonadaceae bacterium]
MTIPLPRKLRCYDFTEPQYKVWGLVRSCVSKSNSRRGARKITRSASLLSAEIRRKALSNDPAKLYEISHRNDGQLWHVVDAPSQPDESHLPKELRRHTRFPLPTNIMHRNSGRRRQRDGERIDRNGKYQFERRGGFLDARRGKRRVRARQKRAV